MGLFDDLGTTMAIYNPIDGVLNGTITYPAEPDLSITGNIMSTTITSGNLDMTLLGEDVADYEVNISGNYVDTIKRDAKIVQGGVTYMVMEDPYYMKLMEDTKVKLKRKYR